MVKQKGAVLPNQGVFQLKEILISLSLVCLPHYCLDPLWIMLAEDSRKNAMTSETGGILAVSMWVSELTPPSSRVVTGLSKNPQPNISVSV